MVRDQKLARLRLASGAWDLPFRRMMRPPKIRFAEGSLLEPTVAGFREPKLL